MGYSAVCFACDFDASLLWCRKGSEVATYAYTKVTFTHMAVHIQMSELHICQNWSYSHLSPVVRLIIVLCSYIVSVQFVILFVVYCGQTVDRVDRLVAAPCSKQTTVRERQPYVK